MSSLLLCTEEKSSGKGDLRSLPLTEDAFKLRANLADPLLPVPTEFGRKQLNGKLLPVMMKSAPKPASTKNVYCKCKKIKVF